MMRTYATTSRRQFLRRTGQGLAAAMLASGAAHGQPAPGTRPNIVVILADDMGYSDVGCYGSQIQTPHIDGLARDGVRFSQFYCAARCCPTRASLLTGLYPHQAGMGGMVSRPEKPKSKGPYQGYLNDRCVTIAEVLGGDGYRTYMAGKWHVGEAPAHWPRKRGFDRYFGLISGASSYWEILKNQKGRERVMALDDERYTPGDGFYMTDATTDFAVDCLRGHDESHGDKPFFLYLPYTAPHWPLHAWPEDIAKYRGKYRDGWDALRQQRHKRQISLGLVDEKWPLSPRDSEVPAWDEAKDHEEWDLRMSVYAAMIDRMDQGIGRVLDTIRAIDAEDNTLVLFLSDNGGCHENVESRRLNNPEKAMGERGSYVSYKRPWANASNTPFRLFKHWVHEGGIATPLIARWPAVIRQQGTVTHQTGHIVDIMATCLDITGAPYPGAPVLPAEGKSLLPVFRGETRQPHDALYWEHLGNRAIRQGKWKLVAVKRGEWELYDLEADRTELNNLCETYPDKAEELFELYDAWERRTGV